MARSPANWPTNNQRLRTNNSLPPSAVPSLQITGGLMPFSFENLTVYQHSLNLVEHAESLVASLKGKASFSLLNQLSRAALSVPLNIAEGSDRWHQKEKRQFIRIAKGSVFEKVPVAQV